LALLIGSVNTYAFNSCLYHEDEAKASAHRVLALSEFLSSVFSASSDYRLTGTSLLDIVEISFSKLGNRFLLVTEIKKGENKIDVVLSDLASMIHRRGIISLDSAPDYSSATTFEKMRYGYITDERGLLSDDEDTARFNLII
jgi:hypothetical protein